MAEAHLAPLAPVRFARLPGYAYRCRVLLFLPAFPSFGLDVRGIGRIVKNLLLLQLVLDCAQNVLPTRRLGLCSRAAWIDIPHHTIILLLEPTNRHFFSHGRSAICVQAVALMA